MLISPEPLSNLVPLCKGTNGETLTQFDMDGIQKIGLVKFDFLGLITLTVIQDAERFIRSRQPAGEAPFSVQTVPLDDPATFKLLASRPRPPASSSSSPRGCATPSSRCARTSSTT